MCYINENIKIKKAYQSLPFLRSTLNCSWWKIVIIELQQPNTLLLRWDKFPDAKESVMKYFSSVVIGDIDAYLYHMDKAFDVVWLVWLLTWVLGFWQHEDPMEGSDWARSQLVGMTDSS
jgi:hypothetical protein